MDHMDQKIATQWGRTDSGPSEESRTSVDETAVIQPDETHVENGTRFAFLDLPGEIRNLIYKAVVGEPREIQISSCAVPLKPRRAVQQSFLDRAEHAKQGYHMDATRKKWVGMPPGLASILRVSRQVFHELAPILYDDITFVFMDAGSLGAFTRVLTPPSESDMQAGRPYILPYVKHLSLRINPWRRGPHLRPDLTFLQHTARCQLALPSFMKAFDPIIYLEQGAGRANSIRFTDPRCQSCQAEVDTLDCQAFRARLDCCLAQFYIHGRDASVLGHLCCRACRDFQTKLLSRQTPKCFLKCVANWYDDLLAADARGRHV